MKTCRVHLKIEGRVQGVYYRAFTSNVAVKRNLNGWVRNLPDGRVEVVFEGSRQLIEQCIQECRKGPFGSRVTDMGISWDEPHEGLSGFEIRY